MPSKPRHLTAALVLTLALALPAGAAWAGAPHYATPKEPKAPGDVKAPKSPKAPSTPGTPSEPGQPSQPDQPSEPPAPGHGTVAAPGQPGAPAAPGHAVPGQTAQPGAPPQPGAPASPAMVQALNQVQAVAAGGVAERQRVLGPKGPVPTGLAPFAMGDMGLAQAPMAGKLAADLQGIGHQPLRGPGGEMIIASCGQPGKSQVVQVGTDGSYASGRVPAQAARPPMAPYVKTALLEPQRMLTCPGAVSPLPGLPWQVAGPIWAWGVEAARPTGLGLAQVLGVELGAATGVETELRPSAPPPPQAGAKEAKP